MQPPTQFPAEPDGPAAWVTRLYDRCVRLREVDFLGERWLIIDVALDDPGALATPHVLGGIVLDERGIAVLRQVLPATSDAVRVDHVIAYLAAAVASTASRAHRPDPFTNYAQ